MKYRNLRALFTLAFAVLVGANSAQAAQLRYARGETFGIGSFSFRNDLNRNETNRVTKVNIVFDQNRNFDIKFTPSGAKAFNVRGTWTRNNTNTVNFSIKNGTGEGVFSGNGTLNFVNRNGQLQPGSLGFKGRRVKNRDANFELKFGVFSVKNYSSAWDNNIPTEITQLFSTKNGSGRVEVSGQRDTNLRRAKVELSKGGDARIELTGNKTWVFEGRWSVINANRIHINLDSASSMRSSRWLGNGEIQLQSNSFDRLNLSGTLGRDRFTANFNAK